LPMPTRAHGLFRSCQRCDVRVRVPLGLRSTLGCIAWTTTTLSSST
jgi:hypothetical protein